MLKEAWAISKKKKLLNPGPGKLVSEATCEARRQTMEEMIKGIKMTIYACSALTMFIITIIELLLRYR